ncbi:MAG: hopanoid biosynthesis-associated protein HpnK [Verrucomicrobiae bacterium]|nr:hopanoid biosynthesis-associated protein HpnK [Verrucomicrobiae bacterium]
MRQLIVTSDDFGMASSVNEAVIDTHTRGVLTSASLMVNGAAVEEAARLARQTPSLAVGLHLTLAQGRAVLPPERIPHLTDADGFFSNNAAGAGWRYFFDPACRREIEAEVRAQIEKFLALGLKMDHLDGHMNIHLHPVVRDLLVRLGGEYPIRALRVPRQPWWQACRLHRRELLSKTLHALVFGALGARARAAMRGRGLRYADRVYGMLESGGMNEAYLLELLRRLPEGVSEVYFHPARTPCADFLKWNPTYQAVAEWEALTSPRVRDLIGQEGIQLVTYGRICESAV